MSKKRPRSTAAFEKPTEGVYDSVSTPGSKFVGIEDIPSGDLNPEELCILCEELKKVTDPALHEAVQEILATHSSHPVPPREEEDGNQFPPLGSEAILVARIKPVGSEVKPHRNAPLPATIGIISALLGFGDFEVFILEHDDEDDNH